MSAAKNSVHPLVVPDSDSAIADRMEDAGWMCNRKGWWHPPSCLAAWPFNEAKRMFLRDEEQRQRHNKEMGQ